MADTSVTAEERRLIEESTREKNWKRWGPYLSERQWGTVREDYSPDGSCWQSFPHDHARSRAYRWGEDGILGITDRECRLCFALSMWNGTDAILKERIFGLTGPEGNHGEDPKELWYYLDSSPTHSYMKGLYKYPQSAFPYGQLVDVNRTKGKTGEFEILDTDAFKDNNYFDVFAEYAKSSPNDILIRITIHNRASHSSTIHFLPTLWYRNSWSWGCTHEGCEMRPWMEQKSPNRVVMEHVSLGAWRLDIEPVAGAAVPELLFTNNETNTKKLWGGGDSPKHAKDAFNDYVIHGKADAVNPKRTGTKMAPHYILDIPARESVIVRLRLASEAEATDTPFGKDFDRVFAKRIEETEEFYASKIPSVLDDEQRRLARQSYAGLLWSKQFYHYVVKDWLEGDPWQPAPPAARKKGRNRDWGHMFSRDVLSMPDKWEYPWFAAWDLAFHMLPFCKVDPFFAKDQLGLFLREWYMHPNGQIPAYEFQFGDVNPPVHAWACWRVYKLTAPRGQRDQRFLGAAFQKLLMNFTWWVNRKDAEGKHIFGGGFLGLDNIGLFDRSQPLPSGRTLEQADGTAWMAFFCTNMLAMALDLSMNNPEYEDIASKFFEHFVAINVAMNTLGGTGLWDEEDGFYYDQLNTPGDQPAMKLKIRSMVGLIPLFACEVIEPEVLAKVPGFKKRMEWFLKYEPELSEHVQTDETATGVGGKGHLLAILTRDRLVRVLKYLFDENEFLSEYGIRGLSKAHEQTYGFNLDGKEFSIKYTPGESDTWLFGGNSNWRGPIWFPVNHLI
ncbi:MAG TPA: hypothetical protein PLD59_11370, partial [Tepidisphaeraceae bacterium]|nr:hypothetical protein [Tepidisphaeraceae bacterium]